MTDKDTEYRELCDSLLYRPVGTTSAQMREAAAAIKSLQTEVARLRGLLRLHGKHDYVCSSEHGRFPKRCDCWFAALAAKEGKS